MAHERNYRVTAAVRQRQGSFRDSANPRARRPRRRGLARCADDYRGTRVDKQKKVHGGAASASASSSSCSWSSMGGRQLVRLLGGVSDANKRLDPAKSALTEQNGLLLSTRRQSSCSALTTRAAAAVRRPAFRLDPPPADRSPTTVYCLSVTHLELPIPGWHAEGERRVQIGGPARHQDDPAGSQARTSTTSSSSTSPTSKT
jgi:hypothetical protein